MMNNSLATRFLIRWAVCAFGLWLVAVTLSDRFGYNEHLHVIIIASFVLAVINIVIRPIIVILSLPAIVITLGLFTVVINGLMVLLASKLYRPLHVTDFWAAMLAGMVIGLVNYLVTRLWDRQHEHI